MKTPDLGFRAGLHKNDLISTSRALNRASAFSLAKLPSSIFRYISTQASPWRFCPGGHALPYFSAMIRPIEMVAALFSSSTVSSVFIVGCEAISQICSTLILTCALLATPQC